MGGGGQGVCLWVTVYTRTLREVVCVLFISTFDSGTVAYYATGQEGRGVLFGMTAWIAIVYYCISPH